MNDGKVVNGVNVDGLMDTIDHLRTEPDLGHSRFRVHNRWLDGGYNHTTIQGFFICGKEDTSRQVPFDLDADEPPILLGENRGPNPVEYLLTALASCMTSSMVYHAAARGIRIEELESEIEGDIDLRGFMDITKAVPKGYQQIRATFKVRSNASPEELMELACFSPVLDTITRPVPVTVNVEKIGDLREPMGRERVGVGVG